MKPLLEQVNFPKLATVLAIILGVGIGTCGLNFVAVSALGRVNSGLTSVLFATAWLELLVMVLSAVGLAVTLIAWGVVTVVNSGLSERSGPQTLFDRDDEGDDQH